MTTPAEPPNEHVPAPGAPTAPAENTPVNPNAHVILPFQRVIGSPAKQLAAGGQLADVFTDVSNYIRRYVVLTDPQADTVTLWVAHTWAFEAADCTPYLQITSATKRAGKTRLLEVLEPVVARPWLTGRTSPAALMRRVDGAECPTLLLDESDAAFGGGKEYSELLRGLLNTGYRRSGKYTICTGRGEPRDFRTFSPKAIAGIGELPGTIADRTILIQLRRRAVDEPCERWRERDGQQEAGPLRDQLASWAAKGAAEDLRNARPSLPASLNDRQADVWEPLFAIADLAGGSWPTRSRNAAVILAGSFDDTDPSVELLKDVDAILTTLRPDSDVIASALLIEKLTAMEDRPWATCRQGDLPLTARGLAQLLNPIEIYVGQYRASGRNVRGYRREAFADAITRYVPLQAGQRDEGNRNGLESQNLAGTARLASPALETQEASVKTGSVPLPHIDPQDHPRPAESLVAVVAPVAIEPAAEAPESAGRPVSGTGDHETGAAPWADRWRPQTISDCVLPARLRDVFVAMVHTRQLPNLLFHGPSGTGKTTVAKAMCAELGINPLIINASEDRGIDLVRERLRPYASPASLFLERKFVILDEADYLTENSQAALRAFMEETSAGCGFMFTVNDFDKIIPALQSRCTDKQFGLPTDKAEILPLMITRAERILRDERVTYDPTYVAEIVTSVYPDFRKVLNILQGAAVNGALRPDALLVEA